jgi:tRNA A-37 threonylcarbamoyl transferase component Bud32
MHAALGTGRVIAGRYRLQAPIGRGAMGIVWRGHDELLHRDVAVKEVQLTALAMPADAEASYQRTLREARTAARLSHPSVVTVFDVVEAEGSPWIVMELIGGRSLDQVIEEDGPLPPRHAAELGTSLLSALATAHAAGVLHRDVKPANVLVTPEGHAVLTDFGIATFEEDPVPAHGGMVVGTPGFTAPERVRGHAATPGSDLWSLGATLYTAVEGRGPFDRAGGPAAISAGVAAEDAPRAPSAGPLGPVIDALLCRDPAGRPDAMTAAKLLIKAGTAAGSGSHPLLGDGWPAPQFDAEPGPGDVTAAWPADPGAGPGTSLVPPRPGPGREGAAPSFLGPPAFADLRMPGPENGQGGVLLRSGSAAAGLDAEPHLAGPAELPEFLDPPGAGIRVGARQPGRPGLPQGGVAQPDQAGTGGEPPGMAPAGRRGSWSRYWRAATLAAGIAAIVVAALLGFTIYSHTLTGGGSLAVGTGTGQTAVGGGAPAQAAGASGRSPAPGSAAGRAGGASAGAGGGVPGSAAGGRGTAGTGTSASPGGSGAAVRTGTGGTGTGGSTGSDGTGTGGAGKPPLAGYQWHDVTAASLGATAGFVIAAPDAWQLRTVGQNAYLDPAAGRAEIEISLSPFTLSRPVAEARYQQATAIAALEYPGYDRIAIEPAEMMGAAAASWRFSWKPASAGRTTVLTILVTLPTSAGNQPYALSVSAPSAHFAAARSVFAKALSTFQPLPLSWDQLGAGRAAARPHLARGAALSCR